MGILTDRKGKTADELTKIKEQDKNKEHMRVYEINKSTPGEMDQVNLIADLTEEEYLGFAGMCG